MIEGSGKRKRQLPLDFRIRVYLKSAVKEHLKKQWADFTPLWNTSFAQ